MTRRLTMLGVLLALAGFLAGCSGEADPTAKREAEFTQRNQTRLQAGVGYPVVKDSLELRNLKRRYELLADKDKIGYVYLIDHGLIFAEFAIKGKVSSLESQFTNPVQLACRKIERDGGDKHPCGEIEQAEPDGSYGKNPEGIFFWTTDGVYQEWGGNYSYSERRLDIQQPSQNIIAKEVK